MSVADPLARGRDDLHRRLCSSASIHFSMTPPQSGKGTILRASDICSGRICTADRAQALAKVRQPKPGNLLRQA